MRREGTTGQDEPLNAATLRQLLTTTRFGRNLRLLTHTTSTNDDAKILAAQGAPEGTVVLAEAQSQGRGRQGRGFASPGGVGIYLSLLLRPQVAASRLPQLTLLVAVAAAEAITEVCALPVHLKWPNDVEIRGKKVAGILTECVFRPTLPLAVVVGIGINVNTRLEHLPPELHQRVASLALMAGHPFGRHELIATLLAHLERLYQTFKEVGMSPVRERWLHYGPIIGRQVRCSHGATSYAATVVGLAEDGALLVQTDHGTPQRVISGDVIFL